MDSYLFVIGMTIWFFGTKMLNDLAAKSGRKMGKKQANLRQQNTLCFCLFRYRKWFFQSSYFFLLYWHFMENFFQPTIQPTISHMCTYTYMRMCVRVCLRMRTNIQTIVYGCIVTTYPILYMFAPVTLPNRTLFALTHMYVYVLICTMLICTYVYDI